MGPIQHFTIHFRSFFGQIMKRQTPNHIMAAAINVATNLEEFCHSPQVQFRNLYSNHFKTSLCKNKIKLFFASNN